MSDKVRNWLPTAIALLALAIAAASAASAATDSKSAPTKIVVRKGDIAPGAVTKADLAPGAVTNKALARGAVSANKIRRGAITAPKLGKGSVTSEAISGSAVTGPAIAPGSIEAGMLAPLTVVAKQIPDPDPVPHNGEWTVSNTELAACGAGEALLGGGFTFDGLSKGESQLLKLLPVINGPAHAMEGQFMSDTGGAVPGQVYAICLK